VPDVQAGNQGYSGFVDPYDSPYRFASVLRTLLLLASLALFSIGPCEAAEPLPLTKIGTPVDIQIPVVLYRAEDGQAKMDTVQLKREFIKSEDGSSIVHFTPELLANRQISDLLHSQIWLATVASAIAWQDPWLETRWTVEKAPLPDEPGMGAVVAVGMVAASSGTPWPPNTTLIGSLTPDGSLGPATEILKRVEAASRAGIKKIIVPSFQRFGVGTDGALTGVEAYAQKLGIECVLADDLNEATERLLNRSLPAKPQLAKTPRYEGAVFELLGQRCRQLMQPLDAQRASWPTNAVDLERLPASTKKMWENVIANDESGRGAYRLGQLYIAREKFNAARSELRVLAASANPLPEATVLEDRANAIRKKVLLELDHSVFDQNDLQSALVLAEKADWLYHINARVEGAQLLVRQAFGSRSDATEEQKQGARRLLLDAVERAEALFQDLDFYSQLGNVLRSVSQARPAYHASRWIRQLMPAELTSAEFFSKEVARRANALRESLLFDPRLATQSRILQEQMSQWEEEAAKDLIPPPPANLQPVGFVPGPAYAPPKPAIPSTPPETLSDVARCLTWVNQFCELEILERKYLHLDAEFQPRTQDWKIKDDVALQKMARFAEGAAREGIASAQRAQIQPLILALIYEKASYLSDSPKEDDRLEGLRQYWRCRLLGELCHQLRSEKKGPNEPEPQPAPTEVASNNVAPTPLPAPADAPSSPLPAGMTIETIVEKPPTSVKAIDAADMPDEPPPPSVRAEAVILP